MEFAVSRHVLKLSVVLALLAGPSLAIPATPEGAARITDGFQTYLGPAARSVRVVPQGETYAMTIDAGPLFQLVRRVGLTGRATPLALTLTDHGDGTWAVAMDQRVEVRVSLPDALDISETVDRLTLTGTWDESLMAFARFGGTFTGVRVREVIRSPGQPATPSDIAVDSGTFQGSSSANPAGGIDSRYSATSSGLSEQVQAAFDPGQPPLPVTIRAESLTQDGTMTGFRLEQVLAILAWVVAHPQAPMAADRGQVKGLIQAALPVFQTLDGGGAVRMLSLDTPLGTFGVAELGFAVGMNGAVADGLLREGITLKGLTLPAGLVPDWAQDLMPQDVALEGQVTGYDAAAAIGVGLSALDLPDGEGPGPEFEDRILAALMPGGTVTVSLNPGGASNASYAVTWEGSLEAGPATDVPAFRARVSLKGIDAVLKALNAAPDDMKLPAMMGLGAMRGIATRGEDGALAWEIDGSTPGQVLVNGMDISRIGQ